MKIFQKSNKFLDYGDENKKKEGDKFRKNMYYLEGTSMSLLVFLQLQLCVASTLSKSFLHFHCNTNLT